jgi:hypothetical protein
MSFTYCVNAKQRIALQGLSAISGFIDEVQLPVRQKILGALPSISGFRKNSEAELKKKCERLATAISRSNSEKSKAASSDWAALGGLWASWGHAKFKQAFPDGPYDFEKIPNEQALDFLHTLLGAEENRFAKEDVERLFLFSGLPGTDAISACMHALPSRVELERKLALSKLPDEVAQVRKKIDELVRTYEPLLRSTQSASSMASDAKLASNKLTDVVDSLRSAFAAFERDNANSSSRLRGELLEKLDSHAKVVDAHTTANEKAQHNFEIEARGKAESFEKRLRSVVGDVKSIAGEIETLRSGCKALTETIDTITAALQSAPNAKASAPSLPDSQNRGTVKLLQPHQKVKSVATIADADDLLRLLTSNFAAVGIRSSDAGSVARIVLSAACAGLLTQFNGSLADVLGSAAALSLGGRRVLSWTVPLGLSDDVTADALLSRASADAEASRAILLRGVNRSAFEIYGSGLRDLVIQRLVSNDAGSHTVAQLFATWVEGPATLPGGAPLIELGPVVNTDDLVWTANCRWEQFKMIESLNILELRGKSESDCAEEISEALRIVDALGLPNNRLWRLSFSKFIRNLVSLRGQDFQEALSEALSTWILPWAKANSVAREEIEMRIRECAVEQLSAPSVKNALHGLFAEDMV